MYTDQAAELVISIAKEKKKIKIQILSFIIFLRFQMALKGRKYT